MSEYDPSYQYQHCDAHDHPWNQISISFRLTYEVQNFKYCSCSSLYKIVNVKIDNIKYIDCGGYGTLAAFSIGKLLYCKFNGNNKVSEVTQQDIAQLPSEYTLNSSIGVYRSVLVNARNTGSLQIDTYGKITLYCPYSYLYGYVIIPIK